MKKYLLLLLCIPLTSQELADVLWSKAQLSNTFHYADISKAAIDLPNNGKSFSDASSDMTKYATLMFSKTRNLDLDTSFKEMFDRVKLLEKYYSEDSKEIFLKTGNYFAGFIKDDLGRCAATHEVLKKNLNF